MIELTLELTNYCPHHCEFCSSDATYIRRDARWMPKHIALSAIYDADPKPDVIHLSGGEPMAHPEFYDILIEAERVVGPGRVRVMSNAIRWLAYNARAIDGVQLEVNLTPAEGVARVNVLKRVEQGRAKPSVHLSRNHEDKCPGDCGHRVVRTDGTIAKSPCCKDKKREA